MQLTDHEKDLFAFYAAITHVDDATKEKQSPNYMTALELDGKTGFPNNIYQVFDGVFSGVFRPTIN